MASPLAWIAAHELRWALAVIGAQKRHKERPVSDQRSSWRPHDSYLVPTVPRAANYCGSQAGVDAEMGNAAAVQGLKALVHVEALAWHRCGLDESEAAAHLPAWQIWSDQGTCSDIVTSQTPRVRPQSVRQHNMRVVTAHYLHT